MEGVLPYVAALICIFLYSLSLLLYRCEAVSASDYVEFSNFVSTDRKYFRHCGQLKEFDIESDRKFFRVTFKSNDRLDGTGFNATYQFLNQIESYTAKNDQINSSNSIKGKDFLYCNYKDTHKIPIIFSGVTNAVTLIYLLRTIFFT